MRSAARRSCSADRKVVVNQVPVVFGSGRPFFATGSLAAPLRFENPSRVVQGDRVTHLVYDVSR